MSEANINTVATQKKNKISTKKRSIYNLPHGIKVLEQIIENQKNTNRWIVSEKSLEQILSYLKETNQKLGDFKDVFSALKDTRSKRSNGGSTFVPHFINYLSSFFDELTPKLLTFEKVCLVYNNILTVDEVRLTEDKYQTFLTKFNSCRTDEEREKLRRGFDENKPEPVISHEKQERLKKIENKVEKIIKKIEITPQDFPSLSSAHFETPKSSGSTWSLIAKLNADKPLTKLEPVERKQEIRYIKTRPVSPTDEDDEPEWLAGACGEW